VYPCPCGYYQDAVKECTCSNQVITRYQKRISGPMLDRIDIHIEVPRVEYDKLSEDRLGEPSAAVQARVEAARQRQRVRFGVGATHAWPIHCNAEMRPAQVRENCQLDETSNSLMRTAMHQMQLSARAYHRVLKLARTIADLVEEEKIGPVHLAEALQYRPKLGVV
jgi:magnesium chelatase family protein